jgi:hypothetical protein
VSELTPWQKYKQNLGNTRPWDMINPSIERVSETDQVLRMKICNGCDHLIKLTTQCKKCGCFMTAKTKLANATCPIGKW